MKRATENSQIRRRSNSSIIYLFIPILNYIFFLFQIRGAYNAIKNYYFFKKKLPNFFNVIMISFKYSIFGTVGGILLYMLLLLPEFNPLGKVAFFYMNALGDVLAGLLPLNVSSWLFGSYPAVLSSVNFSWENVLDMASFIFVTYFFFGLCGCMLAIGNLRSDLKRNLMNY